MNHALGLNNLDKAENSKIPTVKSSKLADSTRLKRCG